MAFRPLLRTWLRGAAAQKVREKAVDAAREHVQAATEKVQAAGPDQEAEPCHVGVLFALKIEAGGLEDLLKNVATIRGDGFVVCKGDLEGRRLALVISGAGRENAAKATEALISGHRPKWVISAGFAGGLGPKLKRHQILIADHLVDTAGNRLAVDLTTVSASVSAAPGVHVGRLLTADQIARLPGEKQSLGKQYEALAVDMETFAIAEECRRREARFLAVRVINDAAGDELPPDVEKLLAQKSRAARLGAAVGAVWRRPSSIKDMYNLRENALLASDRLAKFLCGMIQQL